MSLPHLDDRPPLAQGGLRPYVKSVLRDVVVETNVGLYDWEKHPERPTRLIINVEMFAWLRSSDTPIADIFMDYDLVRNELKSWPGRKHVALLETLADELMALCFSNPLVDAVRLSIVKPDIFADAEGVGIEAYRERPGKVA